MHIMSCFILLYTYVYYARVRTSYPPVFLVLLYIIVFGLLFQHEIIMIIILELY